MPFVLSSRSPARAQAALPDRALRILVGFSQSVSLNYRFAATCPDAVRGVIAGVGLAGDAPQAVLG